MIEYLMLALACCALLSAAVVPWLVYFKLCEIAEHIAAQNVLLSHDFEDDPDPGESECGGASNNVVAMVLKPGVNLNNVDYKVGTKLRLILPK